MFTTVPYALVYGIPQGTARDMLMLAGWVINLAVAEWLIHRTPARPARKRVQKGRTGAPAGP